MMEWVEDIAGAEHGPHIEKIDRMLGALVEQRRAIRSLCDSLDDAIQSMAWWARPGKRLMGFGPSGFYLTGHSNAPSLFNVLPPHRVGDMVLIRPTEDDICELGEYRRRAWGKEGAEKALALRDSELRELAFRRVAAAEESAKCGVDVLTTMLDRATAATVALQDLILAQHPSPERLALQILLDAIEQVSPHQPLGCEALEQSVTVLRTLQPLVAGRTAAIVADYLSDMARPLAGSPLSCTSAKEMGRYLARLEDTTDIPDGLIAPAAVAVAA